MGIRETLNALNESAKGLDKILASDLIDTLETDLKAKVTEVSNKEDGYEGIIRCQGKKVLLSIDSKSISLGIKVRGDKVGIFITKDRAGDIQSTIDALKRVIKYKEDK